MLSYQILDIPVAVWIPGIVIGFVLYRCALRLVGRLFARLLPPC